MGSYVLSRLRKVSVHQIEDLEDRCLLSVTLSTLATFAPPSGTFPNGGVIIDSAGNLYGTTSFGGSADKGSIFEVANGSRTITTLASFTGSNGSSPAGGLIADSAGNLYGATQSGGSANEGTVYELARGSGNIITLASFSGANGIEPSGTLIADTAGNLYGATVQGGSTNNGAIFELVNGSRSITTLASFTGPNGSSPAGGLIADSAGNLYGVTSGGGAANDGVIFELAKGRGTISALASFTGSNGNEPVDGLAADAAGNLYGTAYFGGTASEGTIFELTRGSNTITALASFSGTYGPSGVIIDGAGNLYGTTAPSIGGTGTLFELAKGTNTIATVVSFNDQPGATGPVGGLIADKAGNLYGTTYSFSGYGTVFELSGSGFVPTGPQLTAPTQLRATNGVYPDADVHLSWNAVPGATSYEVFRSYDSTRPSTPLPFNIAGTTYDDPSSATTLGVTYWVKAVSATGVESNYSNSTSPPPTLLDLANLSGNMYSTSPAGSGAYVAVHNILGNSDPNNAGFAAAAFQSFDGSQVVIAFRGTVVDVSAASLKDFAADWSYGGSIPSGSLVTQIGDGVAFVNNVVAWVHTNDPGAHITLTGHSLGGGIAQLLGKASGLDTYAFNAPGSSNLYSSLSNVMAPIASLGRGSVNINYRLYGDQVSLFGDPNNPIGSLFTISDTNSLFITGILGVDLVKNYTEFLRLHSINTVSAQITAGAGLTGALGPDDSHVLESYVQPTLINLLNGNIKYFEITALVAALFSAIDPSAGSDFVLTESSTSPPITSLTLPTLPGVAMYNVRSEFGTVWSSFQAVQPGATQTFAAGVNGIQFEPIDAAGAPIQLGYSIIFTLGFASTGTLSAALTEASRLSAPLSPPAAKADSYRVAEDSSLAVVPTKGALSNDSDPNGLPLSAVLASHPAHGSLQLNNDGSFIYTPAKGYFGDDSFSYQAGDGVFLSQPTIVSLQINAVSAKLVFARQPQSTVAGTTLHPSLAVLVEDAEGNIITTDNSSVTLSVRSGPGPLRGQVRMSAVKGRATFENLSLQVAGTYVLVAVDATEGLANFTSNSFMVTPAEAAQIAFIQQPSTTTAGSPIDPPVVVGVEDRFGNIVTDDDSAITLTCISAASSNADFKGMLTLHAHNGIASFTNLSSSTAGTYVLGSSAEFVGNVFRKFAAAS